MLRGQNLEKKTNCGYNLFTGEPRDNKLFEVKSYNYRN